MGYGILKFDTLTTSDSKNTSTDKSIDTSYLFNGVAKEWHLFDQRGDIHGANTIADSFNVASIADVSTGHYDVTFTTGMSTNAYAPVSNHHYTGHIDNHQFSRISAPSNLSTGAYRIAGQYVNSATGYEDGFFTVGTNGDLA